MEFIKKNNIISKGIFYIFSFVVPAVTMLLILRQCGFYPFGDKTLFIMDMNNQYMEFYAYLRNMLRGDNSFFFCWSRSMGGNFLGLFAYYLSSPLSFLTVFFPIEKMDIAILFLTVVKIGLCGVSFAVFAHYLWNREIESKHDNDVYVYTMILIFSTAYSLISYNMVYSMCPMWLDGVILLPVVLLGVEKLIDGKRGLHYMLALAALFICNYYTGYMIGVFTAIYFIFRLVCNHTKETVKLSFLKGIRFAVCTFLAFGLSAPLILPVIKDLLQGKLTNEGYRPDFETNFKFTDFFGKLKNGVYDSITNSGLPSVYCGMIVLILAVLFLLWLNVAFRERIGAVVILVFITASFYYTKLDIAWHGFQYPTWFPYRYAFIFSFFIIYLAFRFVCHLARGERGRLFLDKAGDNIKYKSVLICLAGILLAVTAIDLKNNGKALIEGLDKEFSYAKVEDYGAYLDKTSPLINEIKKQDSGLYRINSTYEYSKNDAMLFGFNGMTHYSSTFNQAVNSITPKLGMAQAHIWNSGFGATPLMESLFAVSYKISHRNELDTYEKLIDEGKGVAAYKNTLALPMVYAAPASTLEPVLNQDVFTNQNTVLNSLTGGNETYFVLNNYEYEAFDGGWSYTLTAALDGPMYLYMQSGTIGWADVYADDVWYGNYFSSESKCCLYVGSYKKGQTVVINVNPYQETVVDSAVIASLNMPALQGAIGGLREGGIQIGEHKGGKFEGTVNVNEGETIITSIPYDEGWTVKIDGEESDKKKFADTFLALDASAGEHEIQFSYISPGFKSGLLIFVIAVIAAVLFLGGVRITKKGVIMSGFSGIKLN